MGVFDWFYKDPSKKANRILDQIPDLLKQYYKPYQELGERTLPTLEGQYGKLLNDPEALIKQITAGYTASPGYKYSYDQAMKAAENAAAAGGYIGTPQDQQFRATISSGLASQDFNNYLQNSMKNYFTGLGGIGGLQTQGYGATTDLAHSLANILSGKANLAYQGTQGRNQFIGDIIGGIIKSAGSAAGARMGGG